MHTAASPKDRRHSTRRLKAARSALEASSTVTCPKSGPTAKAPGSGPQGPKLSTQHFQNTVESPAVTAWNWPVQTASPSNLVLGWSWWLSYQILTSVSAAGAFAERCS